MSRSFFAAAALPLLLLTARAADPVPIPVPPPEEILKRFAESSPAAPLPPFSEGKFTLGAHETLIFTGQANLVEEGKHGTLEAKLEHAYASQAPRFRTMAWEGDTVYEQWRDLNFGAWKDQLDTAGATTIVAHFGQIEALDGPARLPEFTAAYARLLDQFAARTSRLVLVSPMPFEKPRAPYAPDLTLRNADLEAYVSAIRQLAQQRGAVFIDLFTPLAHGAPAGRLTDDGMHLNEQGLPIVADLLARALGAEVSPGEPLGELRAAIAEKNRLFASCWRPANWSFVYGDRVSQLFGKPGGLEPSLKETFERHQPLIAQLDARIHALALGSPTPPPLPTQTPPPAPAPDDSAQLSPEAELATFTVAPGYEVTLFASERDGVVKPTQISWDERGRLYVACSPTYPHILPSTKPGDFILTLEDPQHRGRAEKSTRFAEGLTMVQGVEPGDGGLYVCDFDQLVHLRDTHGTGHADQRRVVYGGFGIGDTHQLINSITHGPDGSLWFTQGLHAFSRVETPYGLTRLEKAGLWRLDPKTLRLDGFFGGGKAGHNCWGVAFDDFGQVFHKSGDRPDGYWSVPGLVRLAEPDDYHPVGKIFYTTPKTTSLDIIGTRALPPDVQGCAVIGGYFGHVVELHRFHDDGAGFQTEQLPKLLRSTSEAFRPVDVSVGPDGAIYVADWFNPVIGHYQASYADPRRDRTHGRIWRIAWKEAPAIAHPDLASMSPEQLLEQLRSPERWIRAQAKRLLFDLPEAQVLPAADAWVAKLDADAPDYEPLLLEVTGVFQAHEAVRPELLGKLLSAKDPRVRAYGTRVLGAWGDKLPNALTLLHERIHDENPRVRLEAIVACSYVSRPEALEIAAQALESPRDRFIDYALAQSVRALLPLGQRALAAKQLTFGGHADEAEYVHQLAASGPAVVSPGRLVYETLCLNCHQPDGKGLAGVYPPLAGSEWVRGNQAAPIRMLLHGLSGPITVAGQQYGVEAPVPMPPSGLNDQQIADVLTYVRGSFGNQSPPVSAADVQTVRAQTPDRTALWTPQELERFQVNW